ncbi:hypothetical protein D0T50_10040 [Bacteroides sp. 214]|nr:hypothetical protein [Bacteroides sp. 214]
MPESKRDTLIQEEVILEKLFFYAPLYSQIVEDYTAEVYIKNKTVVRKKNQLMRFIPTMFKIKKGVNEYIMETYSNLHFTAPNIYDQKVKAVSNTVESYKGVSKDLLSFTHTNIYSSSLLNSKLLSPLATNARKYYTFKVDSVMRYNGTNCYHISFAPRLKSYQLVKGYMIVSDEVFTVREIEFSGRWEYLNYHNRIEMGEVGTKEEFLPVRFDLTAKFKLLGNKLDVDFVAALDFDSITLGESVADELRNKYKKGDLNLTRAFTLQCDTSAFITDSAYFANLRPIPLEEDEKEVYRNYYSHKGTTTHTPKLGTMTRVFWGQVGDMLTSNYMIDLASVGQIKASPLINPLLLSYSARDGLSYRQEFKYNHLFNGDRLLRIVPHVGYNFKHKEVYWALKAGFDYWPEKRAAFHLKLGNGNRIYSSDVIEDLKHIPDSVFDFDKMELNYFRDFFIDLRHSWEITNGLTLDLGTTTHRRTPVGKFKLPSEDEIPEGTPEVENKLRKEYISFAPHVRLSWTPRQYYYLSGERKINLQSRYPTFTVDWERGIAGVFNSTGKYERIEFDMQHKIALGLMSSIYYRVSMGAFTNQEDLYFVDFANFSRSNIPIGWNDDIGGVFHLLDRRWYNSSDKYLKINFTYETPFLLLSGLRKITRNILNERIYAGYLTMPSLNPYFELGYGVGTHIFDVGVFTNNENGKFDSIGFKFTFELFNR